MNCFPCFSSKKDEEGNNHDQIPVANTIREPPSPSQPPAVHNHVQSSPARQKAGCNEANHHHRHSNEANSEAFPTHNGESGARTFTFRELAMATKNFRQEHLLGEGGFGKLYKGTLQTGEVVAVKRLDRIGTHEGNKEFIVEVLMLTLLKHPNLVSLMGYCADGDQRLLVYEYLPLGSLKSYIHDLAPDRKPLDWQTRMKIASGAAQGLEYLHEKANPPIVYRDLKLSHILLDDDLNPKLSDYGLAKLAQGDSKSHMTPRVMGSYGYCAPEYERHGELTTKSDIYSFGVVLLEIISGRKALDTSRPPNEQNLAAWAQPFFKDPKRFPEMADPLLKREFPERNLNQAVGIAAMCLQEEPSVRPLIGDLVALLSFLAVAPPGETMAQEMAANPAPDPQSELKESSSKHEDHDDSSDSSSDTETDSESHEEHHEEQHTSHSDHESSDSSSDEDDKQHHLHRESKQVKQKSKKNGLSSGKIERNHSFSSSSSASPRHSYSAETPHGNFSTSRQNSIEESHNGSIDSSFGHGRYQEYFSWSMGSSSKFKSKNQSGNMDRGSSKHMELHRRNSHAESEGPSYSSSDYSEDE